MKNIKILYYYFAIFTISIMCSCSSESEFEVESRMTDIGFENCHDQVDVSNASDDINVLKRQMMNFYNELNTELPHKVPLIEIDFRQAYIITTDTIDISNSI